MNNTPTTEAKNLLEAILAEVEAADTEMFKPANPVNQKKETMVGVCDDPLIRKFWATSQFYRREAEHARVDASINGTDIKTDAGFNKADDMADVLNGMFWLLLRERHQLWSMGGIGIRQEWKIVHLNNDDEYNSSGRKGPRSGIAAIGDISALPESIRRLIEGLGD